MNSKNKPNGHGALLARGGANSGTISSSGTGRAASVDASDLSVANATASSAEAGAEREAYADVAPAQGEEKRTRTGKSASQLPVKKSRKARKKTNGASVNREIQPGLEPLPVDGEAFVDAVHAQVDLVQLEVDLLSSLDDKIVQRELAYLRELRYGKRAPVAYDEPTQIIFDIAGPGKGQPMNMLNATQSLLEKLTQTVYLDRVLKIAGVAGFLITYLNAWRSMGLGLKAGFVCSAAAWFVGARFTKVYR